MLLQIFVVLMFAFCNEEKSTSAKSYLLKAWKSDFYSNFILKFSQLKLSIHLDLHTYGKDTVADVTALQRGQTQIIETYL